MANHLFDVVCLALLVVFPAYGQSLPGPDQKIVAITTSLQFVTEDDVDQRTRLDLLLAKKQVGREDVIRELAIDVDRIATAEGRGLLSEALVDEALAEMSLRSGVAPADMMKSLEQRGIRFDTLRKRLKADVARDRLAQMQRDRSNDPRYNDRLDHPLVPKCDQANPPLPSLCDLRE